MQKTQIIGVLLIIAVFVLGACGTTTTITPPPETVTVTPPPETVTVTPPVVTVTVAPSPTPTLVEATDKVIIIGFSFYPGDIVVSAGATVTWTNQDAEEHTVTSDSHSGSFDEDIVFGKSFSYTFTERGIYKYHCHNHDEMRGTVIVE